MAQFYVKGANTKVKINGVMLQAYDFNPKMDSFVLDEESSRKLEELVPELTGTDDMVGTTYVKELRYKINILITLFYCENIEDCKVSRSFNQGHVVIERAYGLYKIMF